MLLLERLGPAVAPTQVHLAVLAQDLLQPRLDRVSNVVLALELDLEAEVGDRHFLHVLPACALLVDFELHLVYLLDMIDGHGFLLRLEEGLRTVGWLAGEEVVVDGGLVLAEFVLHVEEGVVIGVLGVVAVLGLAAGALVDLVEDEVGRDGVGVVAVEAAAEQLLFGHNDYALPIKVICITLGTA